MYISLQPTPTWSQKVTLLARTTQNLSWHRQQAVCGSRSNAEQSTLDNQKGSGMRQHRVGGGICSCCLEDSARCNRFNILKTGREVKFTSRNRDMQKVGGPVALCAWMLPVDIIDVLAEHRCALQPHMVSALHDTNTDDLEPYYM